MDTTRRIAEIARIDYGLTLVFHSHAETHVQYEDQIDAFLDATEPSWSHFCSTPATMLLRQRSCRVHEKAPLPIPYLH